jgi:O-antigen ligase
MLVWVVILLLRSRAGFIGASAASALALVIALRSSNVHAMRKQLVAIAAPLVAVIAVAILPHTVVGERLGATFNGGHSSSAVQAGAVGTKDARQEAWSHVTSYVEADRHRLIAGVGFGPDFMVPSGASLALVHSDRADVRSPHNYYVGTFARLGLVGVLLFLLITIELLLQVRRRLRFLADDPLGLFAALVAVALLPPAALGVVLESPFGALPFFWCLGALISGGLASSFRAPADPGELFEPARRQRRLPRGRRR